MEAIYQDCELEFDEIQVNQAQRPEEQQQRNAIEILKGENINTENQIPIAERIQQKYSNYNKFLCPYSENHVLTTYQKLFNHIFTCKPLTGRTLFICKYMAQSPFSYAHIFLSRDERAQHETICEFMDQEKFNDQGPELKIPDNFKGKKQSNSKIDRSQVDWWEKNGQFVMQTKEQKKAKQEKQKLQMLQQKQSIDPQPKPAQNLSQLQIKSQLNLKYEKILNPEKQKKFDFKGPNCDYFQLAQYVKCEHELNTYQIIVEEFESISNYEQYFNEQTTFQQYSEWLTGEFTALAYGSSTYEQNNMKNFMHILFNSEFIGVNKKFSQKPNVNETLVVISKQTKYIGKFIISPFGLFATLVISPQSPIPKKYRESCWLNISDDPTKNIANAEQLLQLSKQQEQQKLKQEQLVKQQLQLELTIKDLEISLQSQKINQEKIQAQYQKEEEELKIEIQAKKNKKKQKDETYEFYEAQYKQNNQIDRLKSDYNEKLKREIQQTKDELNIKFNQMKRELDITSYQSQQQLQESEQQFNEINLQNYQYKAQIASVKMLQKNLKDDLDQLTQKLNQLKMQNATLKHDQTTLSLTSTYIQPTTGINTDLMCIVCAKRPRVMINMPCKHISHCAVCQKTSQAGKHKICWICGVYVRKTIPRKLIEMAIPIQK